jgi:hypothetical protein
MVTDRQKFWEVSGDRPRQMWGFGDCVRAAATGADRTQRGRADQPMPGKGAAIQRNSFIGSSSCSTITLAA